MRRFSTFNAAIAFARMASAHNTTVWVVSQFHEDCDGDKFDQWEDWYCVVSPSRPYFDPRSDHYVVRGYRNGICILSC